MAFRPASMTSCAAGAAVSPPAPARPAARRPPRVGCPCRPGRRRRTTRRCRSGRWPGPRAGTLSGCAGSGTHFLVLRSSAVPVLPATSTPGIAATHAGAATDDGEHEALHGARHLRARGAHGVGRAAMGGVVVERQVRPAPAQADGRSDRRHLQRRGLHAALADRRRADGQVVADLAGGRDGALGRPRDVRRCVEAEALGGGDEALRAELGAERREDRVARLGEGDDERAAAGLAVGVLELDALRAPPRLHRVGLLRVRDPRLERARRRDDLERRAGRLQAREGDPGEGRAPRRCAGSSATTPPRRAPSAVDRRLLDGRGDRRAHGRRLARAGAREHPCPRPRSTPPGVPSRRSSKIALEARDADLRRRRAPRARRARRARSGGIGPSWPTTCGASGEGEERSSPLASTRAVAGEQRRRAAGIVVTRRRRSPAPSPGKTSARASRLPSLVAAAGRPSRRDGAEDARVRRSRTGTR